MMRKHGVVMGWQSYMTAAKRWQGLSNWVCRHACSAENQGTPLMA